MPSVALGTYPVGSYVFSGFMYDCPFRGFRSLQWVRKSSVGAGTFSGFIWCLQWVHVPTENLQKTLGNPRKLSNLNPLKVPATTEGIV